MTFDDAGTGFLYFTAGLPNKAVGSGGHPHRTPVPSADRRVVQSIAGCGEKACKGPIALQR